ncbi:ribosomal RNA small subunit methyltransferase-like [Olea europaea var. sylvestris]|uniref:Ribosomal RNA small subunit methyltransferase-like n=1 Tax=Olea europaea subsp. europaea TaxID=158383 RepID=A0A8S0TZ61_OLEEU|nr:ribosomal RNA small subunit methyltransferase-like [Olea europaea var. sylvestris]CAA3011652.1 ribosomal RNA small subunit methyltransferase-like [Olea europaea subsp. europaea]
MVSFGFALTAKNKTLGSIFRQKSVLSLLEKNYKTLQASDSTEMATSVTALGDTLGDLSMDTDEEKDDEDMEMDDGDAKASDFKETVLGLLKQGKDDEDMEDG